GAGRHERFRCRIDRLQGGPQGEPGLRSQVLGEALRLDENLAAKSRLTLRATLKAVDAAAEALVSTGTAWSDADALINAMHDPESRAVGEDYLRARGRS
ncbi:MAG: hypothetical protein EBY49_08800, partial [Actinobacteria bacterium]|nr:hypothetical protein [Actinomycetota bacterium]